MAKELPMWAAIVITLAVFLTINAGIIVFLIAWAVAMFFILRRQQ